MYKVKVTNKGNWTFKVKSNDYEFDIGVKSGGITPPDTLLASLGGCLGVYMRKYSESSKIGLGDFSITVEAEFSKEKPIAFKDIKVSIDLKNAKIDEQRKKALLLFVKNCPIHNTLKTNPDIEVKII